MNSSLQRRRARERVEDAFREIGTLVITFAPIDATFATDRRGLLRETLTLLAIGVLLFAGAVAMEWRMPRSD